MNFWTQYYHNNKLMIVCYQLKINKHNHRFIKKITKKHKLFNIINKEISETPLILLQNVKNEIVQRCVSRRCKVISDNLPLCEDLVNLIYEF